MLSLTLLALLGADALPPAAKPLAGKVVASTDSDTIRVLGSGNVQHKVRLIEIDAPESGQAFGTKSKEALGEKVHEKSVRVEWTARDRFGRILGRVMLDGQMVASCYKITPNSARALQWAMQDADWNGEEQETGWN